MEEQRLSRSYLETLSTDDMVLLARRLGLELPIDLNRNFMIAELIDAAEDDEEDEVDEDLQDAPAQPAGGLPPSYNETFIGVLLRDPVWAYAFWEIRQPDRDARERGDDFDGYLLRVVSPTAHRASDAESFTIAVKPEDSAWYLCLPGGSGWYRVELLCVRSGKEERLAVSAPFKVPRGSASPDAFASPETASLYALSGVEELRVLQGGDRASRLHQRCEA